jgi:hypothetical protein
MKTAVVKETELAGNTQRMAGRPLFNIFISEFYIKPNLSQLISTLEAKFVVPFTPRFRSVWSWVSEYMNVFATVSAADKRY